jgi:hypothetical protein
VNEGAQYPDDMAKTSGELKRACEEVAEQKEEEKEE